jgi:heme oxygenase
MISLREATGEKHKIAENMVFNQRMVKGELSKDEYILHLTQQLAIFDAIERFSLPHFALNRVAPILLDLKELLGEDTIEIKPLHATDEYKKYLNTLTQEQLLPHVYLNYLAVVYGGQMIKKSIPGSGKLYEFEGDVREITGTIRAVQKDEWADEVNIGFDYLINIYDELQKCTR